MNKKTIAKIQIVLGIIFLLASIVGFAYLGIIQNTKERDLSNFWSSIEVEGLKDKNYSMESKLIIAGNYVNDYYTLNNQFSNIFFSTLSTSIILIVISLFFITQGIINLNEKKK